jgi:hypothetical protein
MEELLLQRGAPGTVLERVIQALPATPDGEAGNQAAMIMAKCRKGMARQIRNATFTLVDRGTWP